LRGREVNKDLRPATSLVFLIDVSGSMRDAAKLPLVKDALKLLVRQLHGDDRLAIVTYAGRAGVALESLYVNAENREMIEAAIDGLAAGGSTNGAGGIVAAYDLARESFIKGGVNRVILCTDGDFNVGVSSNDELERLIEQQRESGVSLSVLGFGAGNLKDARMETLADKGNGNFAYIDAIDEARKALVQQMTGTLVTIARDVKFQVQFNEALVGAYRLIGYENRALAAADFNDDRKDAGEIGAGHRVTALYEIAPPGPAALALARGGRDQADDAPAGDAPAGDVLVTGAALASPDLLPMDADQLLELRVRYKAPDADASSRLSFKAPNEQAGGERPSDDFRFAAAVAEFGMLLRQSPHRGQASYASVLDLAEGALGPDADGYRRQFMDMVRQAQALAQAQDAAAGE
jgi:Ca-activated chloride channel family protein